MRPELIYKLISSTLFGFCLFCCHFYIKPRGQVKVRQKRKMSDTELSRNKNRRECLGEKRENWGLERRDFYDPQSIVCAFSPFK